MKKALIADIHGNAVALESVLADIDRKDIDKIYVLGDICYRGPEPKRSLALIRALDTVVIKGNADEWVVRGVREGEVPDKALDTMNRERDWTVSQLDASDLDYLAKLPAAVDFSIEGLAVSAFHATPNSLFEVVLPSGDDELIRSKLMSAADSRLYIYAHIHKSYIRYINGRTIMNTGSVGLPFDGLAMASYATIEILDGSIQTAIHRVHVDIAKIAEQYRSVQYPNAEMMIHVLKNASLPTS